MSHKNYQELLAESRAWYKKVVKYHCPILKEDVHFNSKGFHHLLYDGLGHARTNKHRMYRLGLLPLTLAVLKCATRIFQYKAPAYSKNLNKYVEYWALKEVVGKQSTVVTVVLRKIGTGKITFHSIWKRRDKNKKPA